MKIIGFFLAALGLVSAGMHMEEQTETISAIVYQGESRNCFPKNETQTGLEKINSLNIFLNEELYFCYEEPEVFEEEFKGYSAEIWGLALLATFIPCSLSLIGVLFTLKKNSVTDLNFTLIQILISLAIGALISTIFLHVLPEVNELTEGVEGQEWKVPTIYIAGVYAALLVEFLSSSMHAKDQVKEEMAMNVLADKESSLDDDEKISTVEMLKDQEKGGNSISDSVEDGDVSNHVDPVAFNIIYGDAFHNFSDGILIATGFTTCNQALGWLIMVSVILHELPQEMLDFVILIKAGLSPKRALMFNFFSSLSSMLGALIVLSVGEIAPMTRGMVLIFGAGVLTYVSIGELVPILHQHHQKGDTSKNAAFSLVAMAIGTIAIGLMLLFEPDC